MAKIQTRARAVDMLGRQQIAGIQNALSELFKNAYDAYATEVHVDYFQNASKDGKGFLVVRDNGIGMTRHDFENKWLVLGTESKAKITAKPIYRPQHFEPRPITGEKGIGRLAIALLGRQVLILTRAVREDGLHDLVMALVHWGLFEQPGLNLDDIEIPTKVFKGGMLPSPNDVSAMRDELLDCVNFISSKYEDSNFIDIIKEIKGFAPDPSSLDDFFSSREETPLSLKEANTGTHFLIGPSNPTIDLEIQLELKNEDYSFRRQLLGFSDQTFSAAPRNDITTSFRRWLPGDLIGEDLLDTSTFFSRKELCEKSDHLLAGSVDEYGQFSGSLRVYTEDYKNVVVPWPNVNGNKTLCGPFEITFGYLMGRSSESVVKTEEFHNLNRKLDNLGGIYVYRDGIRILPYGDHSVDWLDVEKRRTKGAGYYFFSFRRMFGAVLLTRANNNFLQEKAGREGFQKNEAYNQLRDILMNLLVQLAAEFFRKGGTNTELFENAQSEMRRRAEALERQQKRATTKRNTFSLALSSFHHEVSSGLVDSAVANLRKLMSSRMQAASKLDDQDKAAAALIRAEQDAMNQLSVLRAKYSCKRPTGVALTKELGREWDGYLTEKSRLDRDVFDPFERDISTTLGQVAAQARVYVDHRKRLEERIRTLADERKKELAEASRQANATATDTRQTVFKITERARLALDQTIRNIQADMNRMDLGNMDPEKIEEMRRAWESELTEIEVRHRDALMAARDMLASLSENLQYADGHEPAQLMEALEHRMLALEEQADEDFEMVQLGLAVAIINHEFAASIKRVRRSIQELGQISRKAGELRPLYDSIRTNFEHLDGHLNLFTPLQRRLYRSSQIITGKSIRNYVTELFHNRLARDNVSLQCTEHFLNCQVECYPSTLYPAIINIVDNALFWLTNSPSNRLVQLDADIEGIMISNNGPAIEERDSSRILERGYSRKTGGRGLGLFISNKALQAEKMELTLAQPSDGLNVTFLIRTPNITIKS